MWSFKAINILWYLTTAPLPEFVLVHEQLREAWLSNYLLVNTIIFTGELREKVSDGLKVGAHDKLTALPPRGKWQGKHRESIANTDNHCVHKIHEIARITEWILYKYYTLNGEIYEFAPAL